ncbi:MAG TPA: ROK family transcriptional regulator [Micromonosporaceae bacterium]|nr:ROK family transcriptional regulator [Micromonosporaceae bacterium]
MIVARPENRHQARLLRLLRDSGPRSRAELHDTIDLSRAKVTGEIDRLIERGLVDQAGLAASRGGRRSSLIRISERARFLGIDIGASSIKVAITDGELNVLTHTRENFDLRTDPEVVIKRALDLAGKVRADAGATQLVGAGVGLPGPVSYRDGRPVAPPLMPGWDGYPVRDVFSTEFGCPVLIENGVNTMALGEKHAGIAKSFDDFLFIKIGTGISAGIILGGDIYRGTTGSAGDIGHMRIEDGGPTCVCGNTGCLEAFFGGTALARDALAAARSGQSASLARRLAEVGTLTAADVATATSEGDPVAIELVRDGAHRLGQVLVGLVSFFNPGLVVIGGGFARIGPTLLPEIRSVVYRRSAPLATTNMPIVLSEMGDLAGVVGAARLISDHVFSAG